MTSDPREKILQWALDEFAGRYWARETCEFGDSPIEKLLYSACAMYVEITQLKMIRIKFGVEPPVVALAEISSNYKYSFLAFDSQATIENYRVDFVFLSSQREDGKSLIIECDGHNFHERTKDQAARDRARDRRLQELGHTVYRFTGSEIYRDPMKCALEIMKWAGLI